MSDHNPKPPRLKFLRKLLPDTFTEEEIQTEELRLMRYAALVRRIAKRIEREKRDAKPERKDSTKHDLDSRVRSY